MTSVEYLGDKAEEEAAKREDLSQCQPTPPIKAAGGETGQLRPLTFSSELFFPSDFARPDQTMLGLLAAYELVADKYSYRTTFKYQLLPLPGSEGDPTAIEMRTLLPGEAERLAPFLSGDNKGGRVRLKGEGGLELLQVKGEGPWHLVSAALQFFDRSGKAVARTQVPLFVSEK
jgi:hypothetical protein